MLILVTSHSRSIEAVTEICDGHGSVYQTTVAEACSLQLISSLRIGLAIQIASCAYVTDHAVIIFFYELHS